MEGRIGRTRGPSLTRRPRWAADCRRLRLSTAAPVYQDFRKLFCGLGLGASWGVLGGVWDTLGGGLGASWVSLWASWGVLASWGGLGAFLGASWLVLGFVLGWSWGDLGAS